MTLLTACANMCTAVESIVGPQVAEWIFFAIAAAAGWWKLHKVQATANAGVVAAKAEATKAKDSARAAHLQLAEIKGSLRPSSALSLAPTLPPLEHRLRGDGTDSLEGATSSSGTYHPVVWPELPQGVPSPRPSMPDPNLAEPTLPRPSNVPSFEELDTRPETPRSKGRS